MHQHSVIKLGTSRTHKRFVRIYRRNIIPMYRSVRSWMGMAERAILYGIEHQMIRGEEPIKESIQEYETWVPKTPLQKKQAELRIQEFTDYLQKGIEIDKATPFTDITATIADWSCIRMAGDRRLGQHHMRIYGQAMKVGGQIARVSTTWNVVNRHAVDWASKYTFKQVTELTNSFQAALRDTISRGIAEGKAMPTIGRELRQRRDFMLNHVQRGALDKYHDKLTDRFSQMRGGLTDKRMARIDRMVRRESRKKLRYRGEMIARTETARAMSEGTLESYKVAEVDWIQFEASGDACLECADLDGNMYRRGEGAGIIPVHPNCLLSSLVPVYTAAGWRRIGAVIVGDLVLTHKGRFRKVIHLHRVPKQKPNVIKIEVDGIREQVVLRLTEDHPMIVNGKWEHAKNIRVGDRVRGLNILLNFYDFEVVAVNSYVLKKAKMLYNLSVEEDESYIAKGFVVANCRCSWKSVGQEGKPRRIITEE